MAETRRDFFHSAVAVAALGGAQALAQAPSAPEPQVPRMKFGNTEIGRLVCGCNPFYGFSHFNNTLSAVMREYYTPERVCGVLRECNRYGIDAFNYYPDGRAPADYRSFLAGGGKMELIVQGNMEDASEIVKTLHPAAIYRHGENTDRSFQQGQLASVREWCKKIRGLGVTVGVGTHKPEVIAQAESENWDVDFYAGSVYNRTRTQDEWRKALGGESVEMQGDCYLQSDPPRMYAVMRAARKPCFAFKILAAGRVANVEQAFKTAFASIKPNDGVFIGLFPKVKDEVRENAERTRRLLSGS